MKAGDKKLIFDGLITNGLRHLGRGLRNFESGELDFAVTDAFFGIEIVLKALVFQQQWDLIFVDSAAADAGNLKRGECRTIGRKDAIKRLKDLGLSLPTSIRHFTILENHRNKVVHYFHPDFGSPQHRSRIAAELANAWGALRALTKLPEFSTALEAHAAAFGNLEARLLVLDNYLDDQANAIRAEHAHPERLSQCSACHRETYDNLCLLCGYHEPSHRELTQGDEMIGPADCPTCGASHSVVVSGERARCTEPECGASFGGIHRCEYCGGFFVVENEDDVIDDEDQAGVGSFYTGCENCDGRAGELGSRDD
jgi:hypothetical protein